MRRILLPLLLFALMLLSQQGAMLHEIGHLADEASQQQRHHHPAGEQVCLTCLAFAAVGGGVASSVPMLALLEASFHFTAVESVAAVFAEPAQQRNRGPPNIS